MSRIIVKNLPKKISDRKLRKMFGAIGSVTDVKLKYSEDGVFRQFAFIGYKTNEEATAAKNHFNNSYIGTSKIQVEMCKALDDANKPRARSKYSKNLLDVNDQDAESLKVVENENVNNKKHKKKLKESQDKNEKSKVEDFPKELKADAKFLEFLEVNKDRKQMPVWCDTLSEIKDENEEESSNKSSEGVKDSDDEEENISSLKRSVSDMEYLKSKMKTSDESSSKNIPPGTKLEKTLVPQSKTEKSYDDQFTVKLTQLPCSCKKGHIKQFFHPLKLASLRIPPRNKGFAYVKFRSKKDMNIALNKNKSFLNGRRIGVMKYIRRGVQYPSATNLVENKREEQVAAIAETGRIFVRNLCFSVTEEELRTLFSKYGPIAELHIPVDHYTKEHIGYAFVTYVLPENAVKAFAELDGFDFQGRLMHLIASKPKPEIRNSTNKSSFKDKKNAKLNTLSKSSHNWNTLFLGMNAVADAISEKHSISKAVLLDNETKDSLPVRMAQVETQLVMETRDFLLRHGVKLDTFSQPAAERSKVVLIVKDLPANTSPKELNELFSKHGIVSRVILPPSAITALVEFQDEEGAKTAYRKLCYRKFHYLPLFLEWAPMDIFDPELMKHAENKDQIEEEKVEAEEEIEYEPEEGTTLFVKNLNFNTTEETLERHFKKCGPLHTVSVIRKNTNSGDTLSMGFGFVQFRHKSCASTAFLDLQSSELDGHRLELEFSHQATQHVTGIKRKKVQSKEQTGTKILVRNIPFEASKKEIKQLFQEYGDLKTVRLPTKSSGDGGHRGFGFVDFVTKTAAKRAFEMLCHSTHLLGRRLVLEWANTDTDDVSEQRKKTARDFYSGHAEKRVKKAKLMEDVLLSSTAPTEN